MNKIYDVIIIGAGPAGISASIQLKRYGINFLLLEKESIGGLLKNASLVENYPGFPKGISGLKLISLFKKHLSELEIKIKKENVLNIDYKEKRFFVKTKKNNYHSKYLVIGTGTKPKTFVMENLQSVKIYYDVYKLFKIKDKDVAIIGGGDAAFDYAVSLSNSKNTVCIIHRGSKPICTPALLKKVSHKKNISYFCKLNIYRIYKQRNKILIECNNNKVFKVDYLIAAIGREQQLDFIKTSKRKILEKLKDKFLFYIGDVKNGIFRQASISIGDGIKTAMVISKKMKEENENNR